MSVRPNMVEAQALKVGDFFSRGQLLYKVLSEPAPLDPKHYIVRTLNLNGAEWHWKSYPGDKVWLIPADQIEEIRYVAVHLGGTVLRFIDAKSLEFDWAEAVSGEMVEINQPIHRGTVLDANRAKVDGFVVLGLVKAVTYGTLIMQSNTLNG